MKYYDIHAHLNFDEYAGDLVEVVERAENARVHVINVGVDVPTSIQAVALAEEHDDMYAVVGLHPLYVKEEELTGILKTLDMMTSENKVVGIGECGLDYFRIEGDESEIEKQKYLQEVAFKAQLDIATKNFLPVMIHCRDAYPEVLAILRQYKEMHGDALQVNFHFFAGTEEELDEIIELGFYVSFTGVITFAKDYIPLVEKVPLERIMTETDCPYVTPAPHRGKRNEPSYVVHVAEKVAEIKGISKEEAVGTIMNNVERFFTI